MTDSFYRLLDPLANNILFARFLEAHEQMFYALHFCLGDLVGDDVHASINLHSVCVDDPSTSPRMAAARIT